MFWLIFILIYIISLIIHIVGIWYEHKKYIYKIGDIIDELQFFMWCPVFNTISLIVLIIGFIIYSLITTTKLDELWEKFKDIRIK